MILASHSRVPGGRVAYSVFLVVCSILILQQSMYFGASGVQEEVDCDLD